MSLDELAELVKVRPCGNHRYHPGPRIPLVDGCPECGGGVWPGTVPNKDKDDEVFKALWRECPVKEGVLGWDKERLAGRGLKYHQEGASPDPYCEGFDYVRRSRAESALMFWNAEQPTFQGEGWLLTCESDGWSIWTHADDRIVGERVACGETPEDALAAAEVARRKETP